MQPSVTVQPYGYGGFGPNSHSQAAVLGVPAQAAMPFMHPSAGRGGGFTSQHNSHLMPQSQYGGTGAQGFMPGFSPSHGFTPGSSGFAPPPNAVSKAAAQPKSDQPMVTIKRVMRPDTNEPTVTISVKKDELNQEISYF